MKPGTEEHRTSIPCLRCGQPMQCGVASGDENCWCFSMEVDLVRLRREVDSHASCICKHCLAHYEEDKVSGYQVKQEVLTIGGRDFTIETLQDKQQFHDPDGEAKAVGISSATWSIFGALWPSCRILAEYITTIDFGERKVLEVGCGVGLVSLVARSEGANITASDYHPEAETFVRRNLILNELPPLPFVQFDWTDPPASLGHFELILGSDILYERWHPEQLAGFVSDHLADRGEVIVSDQRRGNLGKFSRKLKELGLEADEEALGPKRYGDAAGSRLVHFRTP